MNAPSSQVPLGGPPPGKPLMRMEWRHLLFMHWPVPVEVLRPLIPSSLAIDEFDGSAWVGLIPFTMRDVVPAVMPRVPGVADVPRLTAFHECNVRTYVTPQRGSLADSSINGDRERADYSHVSLPGVWFFSLDAASRAAVWAARKFFHLPYFHSRMHLDRRGDLIRYSVDRVDSPQAKMRAAWRVGEPLPFSRPGELAYFLTERYALYTTDPQGMLHRVRIWHGPWPLRNASLLSLEDELVAAAGIKCDQSQPPVLHHADEITMNAWALERL